MNPLEPRLREALRRQDPPEGFAERVLQRAQQLPRHRRPPPWLLAASLLMVPLPLGWGYRDYEAHRRAEAERAQAQLALALRITSQKLNLAFKHLQPEPE